MDEKAKDIKIEKQAVKFTLSIDSIKQKIDITLNQADLTNKQLLGAYFTVYQDLLNVKMLEQINSEEFDLFISFIKDNIDDLIMIEEQELWPEKFEKERIEKAQLLNVYNRLKQQLSNLDPKIVIQDFTLDTITPLNLVHLLDFKESFESGKFDDVLKNPRNNKSDDTTGEIKFE